MSSGIPGQWIDGSDGKARAENMLANHPSARAAWIGTKGGAEPRVTVYGRDGRTEQISHSPINSFSERLAELVCDWPAGESATHSGGDDTEAAAQAILNA